MDYSKKYKFNSIEQKKFDNFHQLITDLEAHPLTFGFEIDGAICTYFLSDFKNAIIKHILYKFGTYEKCFACSDLKKEELSGFFSFINDSPPTYLINKISHVLRLEYVIIQLNSLLDVRDEVVAAIKLAGNGGYAYFLKYFCEALDKRKSHQISTEEKCKIINDFILSLKKVA